MRSARRERSRDAPPRVVGRPRPCCQVRGAHTGFNNRSIAQRSSCMQCQEQLGGQRWASGPGSLPPLGFNSTSIWRMFINVTVLFEIPIASYCTKLSGVGPAQYCLHCKPLTGGTLISGAVWPYACANPPRNNQSVSKTPWKVCTGRDHGAHMGRCHVQRRPAAQRVPPHGGEQQAVPSQGCGRVGHTWLGL